MGSKLTTPFLLHNPWNPRAAQLHYPLLQWSDQSLHVNLRFAKPCPSASWKLDIFFLFFMFPSGGSCKDKARSYGSCTNGKGRKGEEEGSMVKEGTRLKEGDDGSCKQGEEGKKENTKCPICHHLILNWGRIMKGKLVFSLLWVPHHLL